MLLAIATQSIVAALLWIVAMCIFAAIVTNAAKEKISPLGHRIIWGAVALLSLLIIINLFFYKFT